MMQISIWQQWASNNSSYFTVVGQFESSKAAQAGADKLLQFFQAIDDWFDQPENAEAKAERDQYDTAPVSEPERQWSEQHDIEWYEYSIDWLRAGYRGVYVVDNLVFVQPSDTWQGARPLAAVITVLGGRGMINGNVDGFGIKGRTEYRDLDIQVTCTAPDEATIQAIIAGVNDHGHKLQEYQRSDPNTRTMPDAPWARHINDRWIASYTNHMNPHMDSDGLHLKFWNLGFYRIGHAIPAFIAWLKAQGCADFSYELTETVEYDD
jgi:hypothetical protein